MWLFIPVFVYPPIHKIWREKRSYNLSLIIALILPIISILTFQNGSNTIEKQNLSFSICPIIFLLFYKYYDRLIFKKYNRHIYFYVVWYLNDFIDDEESEESTSLEFWLKLSLFIFPLSICFLISQIINLIK
jgi:hypothetical protein